MYRIIDSKETSVGERILELLKEKNMKQNELAEKIGVSAQAVNAWIKNKSIPEKNAIKLELSQLFDADIDYILCKQAERHAPDPEFDMDLLTQEVINYEKLQNFRKYISYYTYYILDPYDPHEIRKQFKIIYRFITGTEKTSYFVFTLEECEHDYYRFITDAGMTTVSAEKTLKLIDRLINEFEFFVELMIKEKPSPIEIDPDFDPEEAIKKLALWVYENDLIDN